MMVPKISVQLFSKSLLTGTFALISIGNAIASEIPTIQVSAVDRQSELLADSTDDSIAKIYPINTLLNPESAPATSNLALARRKKRINTKPQIKKEQIFTQPQIQNTPVNIQPQVPITPIDTQTQIQSTPTNTQTQIQSTPTNTQTQIQSTPTNTQTKIQNSDSNPQRKSSFYFSGGTGLFFPSVGIVDTTTGGSNPSTASGNLDLSSDLGFNTAVGFKSSSFWRAELELVGNKNSLKNQNVNARKLDFSQISAMLNGYYDLSTGSKLTPYIGAGIGYGMNYADGISTNSNGLAYQLKVGAEYEIADRTNIFLQYRYLKSPEGKISAPNGIDAIRTQTFSPTYSSIEFGTRFSF